MRKLIVIIFGVLLLWWATFSASKLMGQGKRQIVYNCLPNEITVSVDTFKDVALIEWKMDKGEPSQGYKFIWGKKYRRYRRDTNYIFHYLANQLHFELVK